MSACSLSYLLLLSGTTVAAALARSARGRRLAIGLADVVFLVPFIMDPSAAALLALFVLGGYAVVRAAPNRGRLAAAGAVLTVLFLALVKRYAFLALVLPAKLLDHTLELVGVSYMAFKLIHMLVDAKEWTLAPLSFLTYLAYQLSFLTLLAGPIQRYNDFQAWWEGLDAPAPARAESLAAWDRILSGVIKSGLVGVLALRVHDRAAELVLAHPGRLKALAGFLAALYSYPLFVYFNFSGYCDIVIGGGRLLGLSLPENFNRPFAARNMIDFWNRWHISLSSWIRDYVFMAGYKRAAEAWGRPPRWIGLAMLFLSLFLAGVWHGSTWNFVIFGLIHGIGVVAVDMYGRMLQTRLGRDGLARYQGLAAPRLAAVGFTFHYVCFSFLFFPSDLGRTAALLRAAAAAVAGRS